MPQESVLQDVLNQYFAGEADAGTTSSLSWTISTGSRNANSLPAWVHAAPQEMWWLGWI